MNAQPAEQPPVACDDPVEVVLAYHEGDAHAAIMTLLEDCHHLRQQLTATQAAMSAGMTRGWKPKYDRD